ncbi:MAG: helix-hairpin-helix domain-containing protein, partial [Myxococcota bacterium]
GQYQHDVRPALLEAALGAVVEDCVHQVGVDVGTASAPLLARVAGVGPKLAENIVAFREAKGRIASRRELLSVKGLGKKAFEQAAGFLRVPGGDQPLDASAVHPERYDLVVRMARDLRVPLEKLVGDPDTAARIPLDPYVEGDVGLPTLRDIVRELERPGRDPRDGFEAPSFRDDVQTLEDLEEGMVLGGVVTNVTAFGAFVDVGVHQDGLVHVSELSDQWVSNPSDVVKVGDTVTVKVLSVDLGRRRVGLSMKQVT